MTPENDERLQYQHRKLSTDMECEDPPLLAFKAAFGILPAQDPMPPGHDQGHTTEQAAAAACESKSPAPDIVQGSLSLPSSSASL